MLPSVFDGVGHFVVDDTLCQPFHNRRLSHPYNHREYEAREMERNCNGDTIRWVARREWDGGSESHRAPQSEWGCSSNAARGSRLPCQWCRFCRLDIEGIFYVVGDVFHTHWTHARAHFSSPVGFVISADDRIDFAYKGVAAGNVSRAPFPSR